MHFLFDKYFEVKKHMAQVLCNIGDDNNNVCKEQLSTVTEQNYADCVKRCFSMALICNSDGSDWPLWKCF